jgi:hypothetical protein
MRPRCPPAPPRACRVVMVPAATSGRSQARHSAALMCGRTTTLPPRSSRRRSGVAGTAPAIPGNEVRDLRLRTWEDLQGDTGLDAHPSGRPRRARAERLAGLVALGWARGVPHVAAQPAAADPITAPSRPARRIRPTARDGGQAIAVGRRNRLRCWTQPPDRRAAANASDAELLAARSCSLALRASRSPRRRLAARRRCRTVGAVRPELCVVTGHGRSNPAPRRAGPLTP